jgi:kynurenine formamidase
MRRIDLSHQISDGLVTYPGIPAPTISDVLSREASRERYAPGTEFLIGRIEMAGNTGTYLDTPFHRYADGFDLADLALDDVADLSVSLASVTDREGPIEPDSLDDVEVAGRAVLFHTGWSRHFGTPAYASGHPHLTVETAEALIAGGARLVGIDSLNIDATSTGERPVHSALLAARIPIVEHLTALETLRDAIAGGATARFFAVPPRVRRFGTFPVRAFAQVE